MKILLIENCAECPYFAIGSRYICRKGHGQIDDPDTIPDWCPLDDKPERAKISYNNDNNPDWTETESTAMGNPYR